MQVISPNNVKIYNLSAGKSLPDWISDRKRRSLIKKDPELRDRIELIQDFDMPIVSNQVTVSPDGQYIFASGVYKPRVKCFDVTQYSMKFERCFDSECIKYKILSDDYSKAVFLHNDRYVEFHAQYGKYYKIRIPKFGRDFDYNYSACDLYLVGASNEIYRFNLEQGRFQTSLKSNCTEENNCCQFNPVHELFACGNTDGLVECWDPRAPRQIGILNCAIDSVYEDLSDKKAKCSITALKFRDGLNLAVGTSTGHILLYDIRSNRPLLVKDHRFELPIKDIEWHKESDLIFSIDKRVCKIWNRHTGKPYTSIEPGTGLNNLCLVPNSGMLFMANESPKIQVYYIPSIGPAPKWCSFLDNLTEELESNPTSTVYDDYKFLTKQELETLGLDNLIGTNVLRAYMHGYFIDIRLYKKAKLINEPFNFDEFKKRKIKEKLEKERENRVKIQRKLPLVNTELAKRIIEECDELKSKVKSKKPLFNPLEDKRFAELFTDPNYQIDMNSEEYKLLNPVVQKVNEKKLKKKVVESVAASEESDVEQESMSEDSDDSGSESSSDDEHQWKQSVKEQYKQIQQEKRLKEKMERKKQDNVKQPKFYELKDGLDIYSSSSHNKDTNEIIKNEKMKRLPMASRIQYLNSKNKDKSKHDELVFRSDSLGNKQMTFMSKKARRNQDEDNKTMKHHLERKNIRRSAGKITKTLKKKSQFFKKK
ncbi:Nucleolar 10 [Brachionus plicatilis]|uniref:Nucleolar protein 10 n=1 Tax=Brachionus plicatilis TaxID=10195 RepID=A0A3M7P3D2_BRAPC|nr:Nucleolar 10 [Brachionus plicatilis]